MPEERYNAGACQFNSKPSCIAKQKGESMTDSVEKAERMNYMAGYSAKKSSADVGKKQEGEKKRGVYLRVCGFSSRVRVI